MLDETETMLAFTGFEIQGLIDMQIDFYICEFGEMTRDQAWKEMQEKGYQIKKALITVLEEEN